MVEHHGSTLICVSIYFWFLPSLLSLENLKKVSNIGLIVHFNFNANLSCSI